MKKMNKNSYNHKKVQLKFKKNLEDNYRNLQKNVYIHNKNK